MSKPRYAWWGYVRNVILRYPYMQKELEEMRGIKAVGNDGLPHSHEVTRTTENKALRGFSGQKEKEYDSVCRAIEKKSFDINGKETLEIIELVFWKRTHTLEGAALAINVSYRTARRMQWEFIMLVAKNMGLLDT